MSNASDTTARTERFNDAVRAFTPPPPTRHAKLMPLKEGIVELRQKGASLRLVNSRIARNRRRSSRHGHDRAVSRGGKLRLTTATIIETIHAQT